MPGLLPDADQPGQGLQLQPHHQLFLFVLPGYPGEKSELNSGQEADKPFNPKEEMLFHNRPKADMGPVIVVRKIRGKVVKVWIQWDQTCSSGSGGFV